MGIPVAVMVTRSSRYFRRPFATGAPAQVAELVDALVSNTSDLNSRAGSTPALGTATCVHVFMLSWTHGQMDT